ncbi:MAG: peptide ABC transporter substrate-binding protein [Oligoflexia bacterium]|nr:peptide ABC transporter substrate-binding protein [Oligoflexia bacterium]
MNFQHDSHSRESGNLQKKQKNSNRIGIKGTLVICISFFLPACFVKKQSFYTNHDLKETFRYPILSEPPTLDWSKSTDTTSSLLIQNIMEGLTEYDFSKKHVQLKPALAARWTSTEDKKTWSFFLREDVLWTDGKKLSPNDFISAWERLLNPKTGSEYAYFLFPIKKAQEYNQGLIKDFKEVGVRIGDQGELIVELKKGLFYFPYLLTHPSTFPIRKDIINQKKSLWTSPQNIVTLGPYKLSRWDHDKALILTKNETYYGQKPSIKKVILYIIPDETTIMNLYSGGLLDIARPLLSRDLPFLKKRKDHYKNSSLSLYYYGFNVSADSLKNPKMRQAIAHAISREEIVQLLNRGDKVLKSWIPEGLFAYNPNLGLGFKPKKAKELIKQMGYSDTSKLPKIQIFYNSSTDHKMIAENIQSQLKKNIGLNVELNSQEWKTYLHRLKTKEVELFRLGWLADYPDPDNFMNLMASFSDNNHTGWKNKRFDKLILQAMTTEDGPQRKKLYDQAQKILLEEETAVFPIFTTVSHLLISPRIKNYPLNVMSYILFKNIEIVED